MVWFIVRIELNGGSSTDYTNLHEAMRQAGYERRIVSVDGTTHQMPTAEYAATLEDSVTATSVRDSLLIIVRAVHKDFELFVSKTSEVAWYLKPIS